MKHFATFILLFCSFQIQAQRNITWSHGGIIRGDTSLHKIALVFSADEFGDGAVFIRKTLKEKNINASFFFTGNFLNNPEYQSVAKELLADGNYIGSHSYGHLLYCDWTKRDSTLLTRQEFINDLDSSYNRLHDFGISRDQAKYFMPPYEWYNDTISKWAKQYGLQIINFTPGTYSNADYTTPDMGKRYLPSDTIYNRIMRFEKEKPNGLNGFILLVHAGTDSKRTDKFYFLLPRLINELKGKGYEFVRVDELLKW